MCTFGGSYMQWLDMSRFYANLIRSRKYSYSGFSVVKHRYSLEVGYSRKYPYLYQGQLLGFPKEGGSLSWNSKGMGGYLQLEFQRIWGGVQSWDSQHAGTDECASECSIKMPFRGHRMDPTNQWPNKQDTRQALIYQARVCTRLPKRAKY